MPNSAPSLEAYKHLRRGSPAPVSLYERPQSALSSGAVSDVIDWLGRAIASGHFRFNATLPMENQLGEQVGVSRTVIREGVKILTAKGIVKTARRHGTGVNPLSDWNLLDADVIGWHGREDEYTPLIYSELIELLSIMLPQAVTGALNRILAQPSPLSVLALATLQDHKAERSQRIKAEFSIWAQILDAPNSNIFAQFKTLTYELVRFTYALKDHHYSVDDLCGDLLRHVGQGNADEANLACRLKIKRSRNLSVR